MKLSIDPRGSTDTRKFFVRATHQGKVVRIDTNISAPDQYTGTVHSNWVLAALPNSDVKNKAIKAKLDEVQRYIDLHVLEHNEPPTLQKLQARFVHPKANKKSLSTCFNSFVQSKRDISLSRIRQYRAMFDALNRYAPLLTLDGLNAALFDGFGEHLEGEGLGENTVSSYLEMLKGFARHCLDTNLRIGIIRREINDIDTTWKAMDIIYHDTEELKKLFKVDLSHSEVLGHGRNAYLIQCLTGMRHSDTDVSRWVMDNDEFIRLVPKKTETTSGVEVKIHLRPDLLMLLRQYDGFKIPHFSNNDYNAYIREIGRLAGIDTATKLLKGRKGYKAGETVVKHQLMSSHVARATFICMVLNNGISEAVICKMAGIGSAALKHYADIMDSTIKDASEQVYKSTGNFMGGSLLKIA